MAENVALNAISADRMEAGRRYLDALDALGFVVEGAMWTVDAHGDDAELALLTSLVETVGPQTIYAALFRADEQAKTPREVSPWIVSIYGPQTNLFRSFQSEGVGAMDPISAAAPGGETQDLAAKSWVLHGRLTRPSWIYRVGLHGRPASRRAALRKWRDFESQIAVAA
ncbi:hypothetical protein [Jiella sonneratiae]|uniref:Uncharacterized protein n=1 Tax=Jiella sonneratiae TaxID=2816856 RepID=A0ABS3J4S6_9HYPH|nr:hypothetical protein [Jiella sonneratiae]MBO0904680.1 hypothetical protein [Jiella sonneratiae]